MRNSIGLVQVAAPVFLSIFGASVFSEWLRGAGANVVALFAQGPTSGLDGLWNLGQLGLGGAAMYILFSLGKQTIADNQNREKTSQALNLALTEGMKELKDALIEAIHENSRTTNDSVNANSKATAALTAEFQKFAADQFRTGMKAVGGKDQ